MLSPHQQATGYGPGMAVPDLAKVADVYSIAAAEGHAPTLAVQKRFKMSRSTAGRWVAAARRAGLLEPVGRGESPRLNRKLVAVAQELGVDPEALRCGCREPRQRRATSAVPLVATHHAGLHPVLSACRISGNAWSDLRPLDDALVRPGRALKHCGGSRMTTFCTRVRWIDLCRSPSWIVNRASVSDSQMTPSICLRIGADRDPPPPR